jgi:hypothetical protein
VSKVTIIRDNQDNQYEHITRSHSTKNMQDNYHITI